MITKMIRPKIEHYKNGIDAYSEDQDRYIDYLEKRIKEIREFYNEKIEEIFSDAKGG